MSNFNILVTGSHRSGSVMSFQRQLEDCMCMNPYEEFRRMIGKCGSLDKAKRLRALSISTPKSGRREARKPNDLFVNSAKNVDR